MLSYVSAFYNQMRSTLSRHSRESGNPVFIKSKENKRDTRFRGCDECKHRFYMFGIRSVIAVLVLLFAPVAAFAADVPKIDSGDTAWMLTSTALVLLMTIPGLAVFYGDMVRKHNVLATVMQSFTCACLVAVNLHGERLQR